MKAIQLMIKYRYSLIFLCTSIAVYAMALSKLSISEQDINHLSSLKDPIALVQYYGFIFSIFFGGFAGPVLIFYFANRRTSDSTAMSAFTLINLLFGAFCISQHFVNPGLVTDFFFALYWLSTWIISIAAFISANH